MIKAKIIGAGGYGGVGIIELLLSHPEVEISALVAKNDVGMPISTLYPHLAGHCDKPVLSPDAPAAQAPADVVFFSTPDKVCMETVREELDKGAKVIDYSGDFRFNNIDDYTEYATRLGVPTEHKEPDLLKEAVYGLPELHNTDLMNSSTRLVGNVGCFAIGAILGLAPAVKHKLIKLDSIICDCKSGVSGAGKKPKDAFHYPARYDNINAYRLEGHQHVCEIEKQLGVLGGTDLNITFTAQVIPTCRGILACLYGSLSAEMSRNDAVEAYREFHKDNVFVKVFDRSAGIGTQHVRGSNDCYLIVDIDERTQKLRVISHIDNLMKGQAGNALQNMNHLFGLRETAGLDRPGSYP